MKSKLIIKGSLVLGSLLFALLVYIYGSSIPYINVSQDVFGKLSLLLVILSLGFFHKKLSRMIFISSVIYIVWQYLVLRTLHLTAVMVAIACAPQLSLRTLAVYLKKTIRFFQNAYNNHYWQLLATTLSVGVLIFYLKSFDSYFEGDEWVFFRFFRDASVSPLWFINGFIDTFSPQKDLLLHATPLTSMFYVIQYKLFSLNFDAYLLQSLITHILTSLVFAWFVLTLTKSRKYAFIASTLFAMAAAGSEAVTWIAATYTQNALLFSLISSIFMLKFLETRTQKDALISAVFLFAALLSKETAISFVIFNALLYFIKTPRKKWGIFADLKYFGIVIVIFVGMQLAFRANEPVQIKTTASEYTSHLLLLSSKSVSQSLLPNPIILHISEAVTEMQFPYFNQEKSVRGTNYLMFIQTAAIEFVSHILTLLLLIGLYFAVRSKKDPQLFLITTVLFFTNVLPLSLIFLKFPFWKFQANIDSRHLYSILPSLIIFVVIALENTSKFLQKKLKIAENIVLSLLILIILIHQYSIIHSNTTTRQKDIFLPEREKIVLSMQKTINHPPKKMIIYTTSNKSFYGFAAYILPFQTAFSQVLPVIFDKNNHSNGLEYPPSFFKPDFIGDSGLVSEGYAEDDEYGLGYFLDLNKVVKLYEKENIPIESLFAFSFNGDAKNLEDITTQIREDIRNRLNDRKIFQNWKRYSSTKEYFSFQTDPSWTISKSKNVISIYSSTGPIMEIALLDLEENQTFSDFVSEQSVDGEVLGENVTYKTIPVDLDQPRFMMYPINNESVYFTTAGNGLKIYRLDIYDKNNADLIIRTMEFIDQKDEKISL